MAESVKKSEQEPKRTIYERFDDAIGGVSRLSREFTIPELVKAVMLDPEKGEDVEFVIEKLERFSKNQCQIVEMAKREDGTPFVKLTRTAQYYNKYHNGQVPEGAPVKPRKRTATEAAKAASAAE